MRREYGCQILKEYIKCHHWKVKMKSPIFASQFFTFSLIAAATCVYLRIYNFLFFIPVDYYGNWNPFQVKTSVVQDDARAGRQARDLSSTDDRKRSGKLIISSYYNKLHYRALPCLRPPCTAKLCLFCSFKYDLVSKCRYYIEI